MPRQLTMSLVGPLPAQSGPDGVEVGQRRQGG